MATKVNLHNLHCFSEHDKLVTLNRLAVTNPDLMPHQVAVATGCDLNEAMQVLMLLYDMHLAEAYTLVYHTTHSDGPPAEVLRAEISAGLPSFPLRCPLCQEEINSSDEVTYGFLFVLSQGIQFVAETEESTTWGEQ